MSKEKKYWKGLSDLNNDPEFVKAAQNEFAEPLPIDQFLGNSSIEETSTPRRDFLKFLGFSVAAASLAACETPVRKTIPYLIKPEEITPGVANWYATTYSDGNDYCSILVKTREGRPIKIEGNKMSSITKGGVNARVHASLLSLYDTARLKGPSEAGKEVSWADADKAIKQKLETIAAAGGNIRILSSSINSPSTKKVIADFTAKYPTTKHISYDAISYSSIIKANEDCFGKAVLPNYRFDKAKVIVGFGADFLANWLSPVEYAKQYVANRKLNKKGVMSRHIQFESNLSVTGSNADERIALKPSQQSLAVAALYNEVAKMAGATQAGAVNLDEKITEKITAAAKELWANKDNALVVCGNNDIAVQSFVNGINFLLGSYGKTIDIDNPSNLKQGNDEQLMELLNEMKNGQVAALFIYNANPCYSLPASWGFNEGLQKVGLSVSFTDRADETALKTTYACPDHHYLESWNDSNPRNGHYGLTQPTIAPLFSTRAAQESLMKWSGNDDTYQNLIKKYWESTIFPMQKNQIMFSEFWGHSLQDGVIEIVTETPASAAAWTKDLSGSLQAIQKTVATVGAMEIALYEKTGMGNGNQSNNPWLLEMPDPISKVCWDNYITMSPKQMREMDLTIVDSRGVTTGDVVELNYNGTTQKVPVFPQPGQAYGTIGLAVGYGRTNAGKAADNVGVNAYPYISYDNKTIRYEGFDAKITPTSDKHDFASTQTHHTMMGRALVKETTLGEYKENNSAGNEQILISVKEGHEHVGKKPSEVDLWATPEYPGHVKPDHFWNMSIDLNSCIGCGACVISCQSENNVPVVGKKEIATSREMHWIRIDRYYTSDAPEGHMTEMEVPAENPKVVFQPVMCQHCNHAPCETVCPVLATTHSSEGLNQMTYNRCVGTRYCANNCPYKVRRFNWFKYSDNNQFDYNMNNDLGKMVLNPDVTVRSRGVMEKCTLCVQRIQAGKLVAKKDARRINDGEIQTACAQSCPTNAITFGDVNDANSQVATYKKDERMYHLLEELNTQPSIFYLTKVRNAQVESEKAEA